MTTELYLDDSYLTACETTIIAVDGNKVRLSDTVFYPAGGGQESDTGMLIQLGERVEVLRVKKEAGVIVHYVKEPHKLALGPVTAVIDWNRRSGLMKHHTLLHVLAAVCHRSYNSLCTGNQIYPDKARIDLTGISELSQEAIDRLVQKTNEELLENHQVTVRTVPRKDAEQLSGTIKTVVNLIPESVQEIRLVKIGEIDEQACGGTHVKETGIIGQFVLEKTKNKGKGVTRLEVRAI